MTVQITPIFTAYDVLTKLDRYRFLFMTHAAMEAANPHNTGKLTATWRNPKNPDDDSDAMFTLEELREVSYIRLTEYGFSYWDPQGLILIPLWCWHLIADGETLYSLSGKPIVKGQDVVDFDARLGCTSYGFYMDPTNIPAHGAW